VRLDHLLSKEYCEEIRRTVEIESIGSLAYQNIGLVAQVVRALP
jgi:hypothetical protein